jgi:hypothetical protein
MPECYAGVSTPTPKGVLGLVCDFLLSLFVVVLLGRLADFVPLVKDGVMLLLLRQFLLFALQGALAALLLGAQRRGCAVAAAMPAILIHNFAQADVCIVSVGGLFWAWASFWVGLRLTLSTRNSGGATEAVWCARLHVLTWPAIIGATLCLLCRFHGDPASVWGAGSLLFGGKP